MVNKKKDSLLAEYILYGVFVGIAVFLLLKSLGGWNVAKLDTIVWLAFLISVVSGVVIAGLFSFFLSRRSVKQHLKDLIEDIVRFLQQKAVLPLEYKNETCKDIEAAKAKILSFISLQAERIVELTRQKKEYEDTIARFTDGSGNYLLKGGGRARGETKDLTVLFTDFKNFSEIFKLADTGEVIKFINSYLTEIVNIIHSHKGTIVKFIGEEVMAVFEPLPEYSKENGHELRAIAAALEIIKKLGPAVKNPGILKSPGVEISSGLGIGLHSGQAVIGTIGSEDKIEFTVLGGTVEIAGKIALASQIDAVLISAETYERAGKKVEVKETAPVELGGKEGLHKVFTVKSINLIIR